MNMQLTIDTNILVKAFIEREPAHSAVLYTLITSEGPRLCLDTDGFIKKEYDKNLSKVAGYWKWYQRLSKCVKAIEYHDNRLPKSHCIKLSTIGCHEPSDLVFIGVAFNSGKIFISEDSDVGKGPKGLEDPHPRALNYLMNVVGICVYDAEEAVEIIQKSV
jgi:predicted nucleic acid-binding protein